MTIPLNARDIYSPDKLLINKDENYLFFCNNDQFWMDWFIKTSPNGFYNLLASIHGLRIKSAKCFCLCGAYNNSDNGAFAIGIRKEVKIIESGTLSFFANDSSKYYKNNKGTIELNINRIQ